MESGGGVELLISMQHVSVQTVDLQVLYTGAGAAGLTGNLHEYIHVSAILEIN